MLTWTRDFMRHDVGGPCSHDGEAVYIRRHKIYNYCWYEYERLS